MPLAVLGVLILWIGWWGFNPGSTMAAIPDIADIALTTNLAAAAGVLGAMGMSYVYRRNVDVGMGGNGAIAALVAITAPCAFVAPWASIVIGFVAGIIMYATLVYVDKIGVDDPLGAIAAHGMGGIWGTLSCGLFTTPALAAVGQPGLFYGGGLYQLGIQALGIVAAGGFVFLASLAVFADAQGDHRYQGQARAGARRPRHPRAWGLRLSRPRRHRLPEREREQTTSPTP